MWKANASIITIQNFAEKASHCITSFLLRPFVSLRLSVRHVRPVRLFVRRSFCPAGCVRLPQDVRTRSFFICIKTVPYGKASLRLLSQAVACSPLPLCLRLDCRPPPVDGPVCLKLCSVKQICHVFPFFSAAPRRDATTTKTAASSSSSRTKKKFSFLSVRSSSTRARANQKRVKYLRRRGRLMPQKRSFQERKCHWERKRKSVWGERVYEWGYSKVVRMAVCVCVWEREMESKFVVLMGIVVLGLLEFVFFPYERDVMWWGVVCLYSRYAH